MLRQAESIPPSRQCWKSGAVAPAPGSWTAHRRAHTDGRTAVCPYAGPERSAGVHNADKAGIAAQQTLLLTRGYLPGSPLLPSCPGSCGPEPDRQAPMGNLRNIGHLFRRKVAPLLRDSFHPTGRLQRIAKKGVIGHRHSSVRDAGRSGRSQGTVLTMVMEYFQRVKQFRGRIGKADRKNRRALARTDGKPTAGLDVVRPPLH